MMLERRRLLLGLAASSGLTALPAESFAKARRHGGTHHHGAERHAALHGHAGRRHKEGARLAKNEHHDHHEPAAIERPVVRQAALDLGAAPRRLKFHNLHTDEKLDAVFWEDGQYVPDALHAVNHVLRDFRTGDIHMMDPGLLDLLVALRAKTESESAFHVISGYRSPQTNALLRAEGGEATGVAKKSLHLQGQAVDIRLGDVDLYHLHSAAMSLGRGGVGYYATSNFVHVDVGAVRHWSGV